MQKNWKRDGKQPKYQIDQMCGKLYSSIKKKKRVCNMLEVNKALNDVEKICQE